MRIRAIVCCGEYYGVGTFKDGRGPAALDGARSGISGDNRLRLVSLGLNHQAGDEGITVLVQLFVADFISALT